MYHITNKKRKGSQQLLHYWEKNAGSTYSVLLWPNLLKEGSVGIMGMVESHSGGGRGNRYSLPPPTGLSTDRSDSAGRCWWCWKREELWRGHSWTPLLFSFLLEEKAEGVLLLVEVFVGCCCCYCCWVWGFFCLCKTKWDQESRSHFFEANSSQDFKRRAGRV